MFSILYTFEWCSGDVRYWQIGIVCNPENSELESEKHIRDELSNPTDGSL